MALARRLVRKKGYILNTNDQNLYANFARFIVILVTFQSYQNVNLLKKKSNVMKIVYLSIHVSPPWACHALPSLPPRFCLVSCVILQAQLTHFCKILNSKIEVRTVTSPVYIGLATSFMVQKCLIYDYLLVVSLKCNIYQFNKLRNISNIERQTYFRVRSNTLRTTSP